MDKFLHWWDDHEPREQLILAVVAGALLLFLLFFFVISPILDWRNTTEQRLERTVADLGEVKQLVARLKAQQQSGGANKNKQNLSVLIDKSLQENQLTMRGFQPGNKNDARLRLENAAYPDLAQWLHDLEYRHGVSIEDLSLTPSQTAGRLSVSLRIIGN